MFDIIAGTAGIVGLGLTVWTLIVAKQARTAAREARAAIRMDNAAEEFKKIAIIANEFLGHVELDQVDSAYVRARDLMVAMSIAAQRWKSLIPENEVIRTTRPMHRSGSSPERYQQTGLQRTHSRNRNY